MLHRLHIFLLAALFGTLAATAQDVTIEAALDSTSILIGQQLRMKTVVTCEKGARVQFPDYKDNKFLVPGVEVLEAQNIDTTVLNNGQRWELKREYIVTSFDSAAYIIPPFQVKVNDSIFQSRNELGLRVNTLDITDDDLANPRPLMAPVDAIFEWSPRLVSLCLVPIIALCLIFFISLRICNTRPFIRRIKVRPPTPPQVAAFAAIESLRPRAASEDGQKAFYMELADVLRSYIADRYGFNAREMTTEEILAHLERAGDTAAIEELRSVLSTADLVKFAKYRASTAETDRNVHQVTDYVETTKVEPKPDEIVEKTVVIGDVQDQRIKYVLYAAMGILAVGGSAIFGFVIYQIWETFL